MGWVSKPAPASLNEWGDGQGLRLCLNGCFYIRKICPQHPNVSLCAPLAMGYVQNCRSGCKYTSSCWTLTEILVMGSTHSVHFIVVFRPARYPPGIRGIHPPKPMMHIAYSPFFLKIYPYFDHDAFKHHALHGLEAPARHCPKALMQRFSNFFKWGPT